MADYHGGVVFEWQKKLLAEQASTTNDMEVGPSVTESLKPPMASTSKTITNPMRPPGGYPGPPRRGRQGSHQSPFRQGAGVFCPCIMWTHSGLGVLGAPLAVVVVVAMWVWGIIRTTPPYTIQERQGHHYNNGGAFSHPRDIGYGANSHYIYDMQYDSRPDNQNRYRAQVRHFDSNEPYERRNEVDFNISTSNSFYPLRALEGPYDNPVSRVGPVN